ncbi:MAG: NAD-dependent epimerase/dehydratase family protein [Anaerolineaceae bacterium]
MTMFVTGGTSSIGRVFVKEMSDRGQAVCVLVRRNSRREVLDFPGVTFAEGDVTDPEAVRRGMEGCRSVTHMAAVVGQNLPEAEWWLVNRDGTRNVLQAALDQRVESMVQVSSLSVLGYTDPGETADESRPVDTSRHVTLYQKTKFAADEIGREFAAKDLPVRIVYPGFGFGCSSATSHPSMQDQTLLRMAAGKPTAVMGSGKNRLCAAYYNDTAAGILLAHEKGLTGEGYILGNANVTFTELWVEVARVLGKKPPRRRIPLRVLKAIASISRLVLGRSALPPEIFEMFEYNWCFSTQKAREQLGWQPRPFDQAIRETWLAYQEQGW